MVTHDLISDYSKLWIVSQLGEEKCNRNVIFARGKYYMALSTRHQAPGVRVFLLGLSRVRGTGLLVCLGIPLWSFKNICFYILLRHQAFHRFYCICPIGLIFRFLLCNLFRKRFPVGLLVLPVSLLICIEI